MQLPRFARVITAGASAMPQFLASLQSLLISVLIARNASLSELGAFGVSFALWAVSVGAIRAVTSEIYIFQIPHAKRNALTAGEPLSAALILACIVGVCIAGAAIAFPPLLAQLLWIGFSLPAFVLHDTARNLLTALARHKIACGIDVAMLSSIAVGYALIGAHSPPFQLQIGWATLSLMAGLGGWWAVRSKISFGAAQKWKHGEHGATRYLTDYLLTNSLVPIATVFATALGGLVASAAMRAAQMMVAPIGIVARGLLIAFANPSRASADRGSRREVLRLSIAFAVVIGVSSAGFAAIVVMLPLRALAVFLGESASLIPDIFLPAVFGACALGVASGAGLGLRVLNRISIAILAKTVSFPVTLGAVIAGIIVIGAPGALWGIALGETLRASISWIGLGRIVRARREKGAKE